MPEWWLSSCQYRFILIWTTNGAEGTRTWLLRCCVQVQHCVALAYSRDGWHPACKAVPSPPSLKLGVFWLSHCHIESSCSFLASGTWGRWLNFFPCFTECLLRKQGREGVEPTILPFSNSHHLHYTSMFLFIRRRRGMKVWRWLHVTFYYLIRVRYSLRKEQVILLLSRDDPLSVYWKCLLFLINLTIIFTKKKKEQMEIKMKRLSKTYCLLKIIQAVV
jgi:hypothetical protein